MARAVAANLANEADARRATSVLYHVTSAVLLAWEGQQVHARRGDARRLLLARLVLDHRLGGNDPFAITAGADEQQIASLLLSDATVPLAEVQKLLK